MEELNLLHYLLLGVEYFWPGMVFLTLFRAAHGRKCEGGVVDFCEAMAISIAINVFVCYAGDKYGITCIDDIVIRMPLELIVAYFIGLVVDLESKKASENIEQPHEQNMSPDDSAGEYGASDLTDATEPSRADEQSVMPVLRLIQEVEALRHRQIAQAKKDILVGLNTAQQIEQPQKHVATDGKWVLYYHGQPVDFTGVEQSSHMDNTAYVTIDLSKLENSSVWSNDACEDGIVFRGFDEETDTVTFHQLW